MKKHFVISFEILEIGQDFMKLRHLNKINKRNNTVKGRVNSEDTEVY